MPPASPSRRTSARALVALLAVVLVLGVAPGIGVGVEKELREARKELQQTRARIRERAVSLRKLQRDLNRLATEMAENEDQIHHAEEHLAELDVSVENLERQLASLQARLDDRNRVALIQGPDSPILYLLTATSAAEAAARVSVLTEMNRRDEILAWSVERARERLSRARAEQARLSLARELALMQLKIQRVELRDKLARSRRMFERLHEHREEVLVEISKYRPFAVCPMAGPHAISDSFGIFVHRSKARGGDHVHQGVDIMAASGTPIVAPFDGMAVASPNDMGGEAVKVFGDYGYVYNAHLSAYGRLGPVETGDVIGYVGATGNALGPHNHFEWHPNGGAAVDPYPFLIPVCS